MILQEELSAKFDASTDCLIMHKLDPSKLQLLSLQAAEKFSQVSVLEQGNPQIAGSGTAPAVRTDARLNKFLWSQDTRYSTFWLNKTKLFSNIPNRVRGRNMPGGRRNDDKESAQNLYTGNNYI